MKIKLLISLFFTLFFAVVKAATPPSATISYPLPWCANWGDLQVILEGTTGGTFAATPGLAIDPVTGTILPSQSPAGTFTVTYTIASTPEDPAFVCTTMVVLFPTMIPEFSFPTQYCTGSQIPAFPTTSDNGVSGTWNPAAISNQVTTTYTFTPNPGQCATATSVTVYIGDTVVPEFGFSSSSYCLGEAPALPTSSLNGITGSWIPSVIETSGAYTFTPDAGQCALPRTEFFTINPLPTVTISGNATVCSGQSAIITFTGTPNSVVVYTYNGGPTLSIVLDSTGNASITTGALSASTAICLVSASNGGLPGCTNPLSGCVTIVVLPTIQLQPMPDVAVCDSFTLPTLSQGHYFTQPNGNGLMLHAGDQITTTQEIYVYAENQCGGVNDSFMVTIISVQPTITTQGNMDYIYLEGTTVVQPLELSAQPIGDFSYQWFESGVAILGATNATYLVENHLDSGIHNYSVRVGILGTTCSWISADFQVHETQTVPAPVGDSNQTFTLGQTLADVIVYGQNILWYDSLNRGVNSAPLPLSTVLQEGVTYYATQTINGHESPSAFSITIQFLATDTFAFKDLKFGPNPVSDFLQLSSKDKIQKVTVLNLMGQKILQQNINNLEFSLPMGQLKTGNYFVKLESENKSQVIKVIKE